MSFLTGSGLSGIAASARESVLSIKSPKTTKDFAQKVLSDVKIPGQAAPTPKEVVNQEVQPAQGQPSSTPNKESSTVDEQSLPIPESYRNGRKLFGFADTPELVNARTLGEPREEVVASISISAKVIQENGVEPLIVNSYNRFFLQNIVESETEKMQIVETFTDFYTFFYGKRPPVYRFTGTLLNDDLHKWGNDFLFFYQNFFRGTKAVELQGKAIIEYDGRIVNGFIINVNMQQNSMIHKGIPFAIDVLVIDHFFAKFSADIKDLIETKRRELEAIQDTINAQLAQINKNIPSEKSLIAKLVVSGRRPPSRTKQKGKEERVAPQTSVAPVVSDANVNQILTQQASTVDSATEKSFQEFLAGASIR